MYNVKHDKALGTGTCPCPQSVYRYGYKPHSAIEYDELTSKIREEMSKRNIVVTRDKTSVGAVHSCRCTPGSAVP